MSTRKNSVNKSNINDASYGELIFSQKLIEEFKLPITFSDEVDKVLDLLKKSHPVDYADRVEVQKKCVKGGAPLAISKLRKIEENRSVKVADIKWVGGTGRGKSVSDVNIIFSDEYLLPLSLKANGENTDRNLGAKKFKDICGIDLKPFKDKLFKSAKRIYSKEFPETDIKTLGGLKKSIRAGKTNIKVEKKLMKNGYKQLREVSRVLLSELNQLSLEKKIDFAKFISGINNDSNLETLVMKEEGSYFKTKINFDNVTDISFGGLNADSTTILVYINRKAAYRINLNNTNGVGISNFAFRVFRFNNLKAVTI